MNNKRICSLIVSMMCLVLALYGCGAGSAASTSGSTVLPPGNNPGQAATLTLTSSARIINTGNAIPVAARVMDSAGKGVAGIAVVFTSNGAGTMNTNYQLTDTSGYAKATIFSTAAGKSSVTAFSNTLSSSLNVYFVNGAVQSKITLSVDSNGNNIYNEPADFIVSTSSGIMSKLMLTFIDGAGEAVANKTITLASDSTMVTLSSTSVTTDNTGNAYVFATFANPQSGLLANTVFVDITASASDGTVGTIALQLKPFIVGGLTFYPDTYAPNTGDTANLTACITNSSSTPVQLANLAINFTASPATSGIMLPFAFTDATGCAKNTFKAITAGPVILTASFTSVSSQLTLNVQKASQQLQITPTSASVNAGDSVMFMITGGTAPYTVTSLNPSLTNPATWNVATSGGTFQVAGVKAGSANIIVTDAAGVQVQVALTVVAAPPGPSSNLAATPSTVSVVVGQPQLVVITGGTAPYTATSLSPSLTDKASWDIASGGGSFQVIGTNPGSALINVVDAKNAQIQVTLNIANTQASSLTATPSNVSLVIGEPQIVVITGGTAPYTVTSLNPSLTNPTSWSVTSAGGSFQVTPTATGTALINVVDAKGTQIQITITIQ